MGVVRFFGRFFKVLFMLFGAYLLFINLYVFAKGESSYFGFTSMVNMFNDMPSLPSFDESAVLTLGNTDFSIYLPNLIDKLYNDAIGTSFNYWSLVSADNESVLNIINVLVGILALIRAPLYALFDLFLIVISILWDLLELVPFLFKLLKGTYNVPLT